MGKCLSKSPKVQSQTPGQHPGQGAGSNNNAAEGTATANAAQNQGANPMVPDVCAQRDPALDLYVLSVLHLCACTIHFSLLMRLTEDFLVLPSLFGPPDFQSAKQSSLKTFQ